MRETFVESLLRKSVLQSKVAARFRLNVLCWCTFEACKYSIRSAIIMAAAMTSCSTAILAAKSILHVALRGLLALLQERFMSKCWY